MAQGEEDWSRYLALYKAASVGDWETAKRDFFDRDEKETTAVISPFGETALHVAVSSGRGNVFIRKLVEMTPHDALARLDDRGFTALHRAAVAGNKEAAIALVNKNPDLLYISRPNEFDIDQLPVHLAAKFCRKDTLKYLISKSDPDVENSPFRGRLGIELLINTISSEFFDVALDLARNYPDLARMRRASSERYALSYLAEKATAFFSGQRFCWWQNLVYRRNMSVPQVKDMREKKEKHRQEAIELVKYLCSQMVSLPQSEALLAFKDSIIVAARYGISEIVEVILDMYPPSLFFLDANKMDIFQLAASNRFENVFNLIYTVSDRKYEYNEDVQRNNLMHVCAKLAPPARLNLVPGAALQMQRELQWFNEMEKFISPAHKTFANREHKTPKMIFSEEHRELKAEGERWMKDTANACTLAAALIATVVFAAAFTVPGGVASETGVPILSHEFAFALFAISDAVSLFTSITSLLMFLSILTSRYAEEDFLHVLPQRLSIGLLSLFVSIAFMMVAFSATLFLVTRGKLSWFITPVTVLACLPVTSFVLLQFPLLVDVVYSTYGPGIFGKKK